MSNPKNKLFSLLQRRGPLKNDKTEMSSILGVRHPSQSMVPDSQPQGKFKFDLKVFPKSTLWIRADWFSASGVSYKKAHAHLQMKR